MIEVQVDRLNLRTLFDSLELPETTGYRYLKTLDGILSGQDFWNYQKGDGSVDKEGIEIITIYYQLTRQHKIQFCKKQLIKELQKHGYNIQQNQQKQQSTYRRNTTGQRTESATNEQQPNAKSSDFYDSLFGL